jgi:ectoine hydroxylase-related dioxygenase (phytanoyl-CoA dioxygenase family)
MDDTRDRIEELESRGYCVLPLHLPRSLVDACRTAVWPVLLAHVERHEPNRGAHRHFFPMPFEPPAFAPDFFFDDAILRIVRGAMDDRVVADQWGCDVPLQGSDYQGVHADYSRPLFAEAPDLPLPPYMLVISFGLSRITRDGGPIEIAPGTHRLPRAEALRAVDAGEIPLQPICLELGDVLIRHPSALHRGTPNTTTIPRALVTIRYVRRWYADDSRDVNAIPRAVWDSLTAEQQRVLRFPVASA